MVKIMKENNTVSEREVRYLKRTIKKQENEEQKNNNSIKFLNNCTKYYKDSTDYYENYSNSLYSISGKGRAIVSETGSSDRVTIEFETDSTLSLITIKNRIKKESIELLIGS